jgi:MtN3 and saliva related transmembrane protein
VSTDVPKYVTTLGLVAGAFTTLSFLPQLLRTWRSRRSQDISGLWLISFISGVTLWLVYGLLLPSVPVIIANAATLALTLPIAAAKLYFREKN